MRLHPSSTFFLRVLCCVSAPISYCTSETILNASKVTVNNPLLRTQIIFCIYPGESKNFQQKTRKSGISKIKQTDNSNNAAITLSLPIVRALYFFAHCKVSEPIYLLFSCAQNLTSEKNFAKIWNFKFIFGFVCLKHPFHVGRALETQ